MTQEVLPPLARSALDRDYLARSNPELFDELWSETGTKILAMHDGKVLAGANGLRLLSCDQVPTASLRVYLGRTKKAQGEEPSGTAVVLAVLSDNGAREIAGEDSSWHTLREIGPRLSDRDSGILVQALALNNWHQSFAFCPRCGTPTVIEQGGWVRRCFKDDYEVFPRTDPAVIVAITDEQDRILLGSQTIWEENRWSVLAGFVEPGEALEAAVHREMKEESGLELEQIKYVFSQGWPYPFSLMLGFEAKASSQATLIPDGTEIRELRWFSKSELMQQAANLLLPGEITISRALIERWLGEKLPTTNDPRPNGQQ